MDFELITEEQVKTKVCFKCGEIKYLNDFYKHSKMADGHVNKCKECNKRDVAENYQVNREYYAKYEKSRYKRQERRRKMLQYQRERRSLNPEKYKANNLTTNAIRDGRLTQKPCIKCGAKKTEAHHPDYNNPLDVEWLCRSCHLAEHGKKAYVF